MAESFSETHSGFNMTSGLPFAATNERRDLSTFSQMRLLIMEQQQNDVAVEASTERDQSNGFSGDCFLEECNLPLHCKASDLAAGNGAQASTQVTSRESNAVASPEMQEQSGIVSVPSSIESTNMSGGETKCTLFQKIKTFLSVQGLTLFKREVPAAPAFGCESARAASLSPRNLKPQENKPTIHFQATMKRSELLKSAKLLTKHNSCLFQRFSVCNSDECPLETRKVRLSSVSRTLRGLKTLLEFTVGRKPNSFDLANLNYCDYENDSEVPKVATLTWKQLSGLSRNGELAKLSTNRICAYDDGIPHVTKRGIKHMKNGSETSESNTLVAAEDWADLPKPGLEIPSSYEAKVSVVTTPSIDGNDETGTRVSNAPSLAMVVYKPKIPRNIDSERIFGLDLAFAESRLVPVCSGNTPAPAASEQRLILASSEKSLVLASSKESVLELWSDGALNRDNHDKCGTPVSSTQQFDQWFTGEGLLPLFRKECLTPEFSLSAGTSAVVHDCPLVPEVNNTVLYSANTERPCVTNEDVESALPAKTSPQLKLKTWLRKPKSQLWTFLDMEAFFVRALNRKTFKLRCLEVKLNIIHKTDLEQDFSELLNNVRLEFVSEEPKECESIADMGSSSILSMSAPSFARVSKSDVCLNSLAALKHQTCSPSLLRHLVRSKDALMVQCKKGLLAQYDFHDQVEDYLISLLESTQATGDLFLKVCTDMAGNLWDDEYFDYDFFLDDYLDHSHYLDYPDHPDCDSKNTDYSDLLDLYFEDLDPISSKRSDTRPSDDLMDHYEERLCAIMEELEDLKERDEDIKETIDQMKTGYQQNIFNVLRGFKHAFRLGKTYRDDFRKSCKEIETDLELTEAELNQVIGCASITDQEKFWEECMDLQATDVLKTKVRRTKALYEIVSNSRSSLQSAYEEVTLPFLRLTYNSQGIKRDSVPTD